MSQRSPIPNMDALGRWLLVETMTSGNSALIGPSERHDQIELGTAIDNPADVAQNSIHFAKCSETIDVNRLQTGGLRQQFLVGHFDFPPHWARKNNRTSFVFSTSQFHVIDNCRFRGVSCSKTGMRDAAENAPAVEAPAPFAVTAGATNSRSL